MSNRLFAIGERVRIHPASDWYMRGVIYAIITSTKQVRTDAHDLGESVTVYYLRPDTAAIHVPAKLRIKLRREYLLPVDGE